MTNNNKIEYSKKACHDALSYFQGKYTKEEFIKSYTSNAAKSLDYAFVIGEVMQQGISERLGRENALQNWGITEKEFDDLSSEQGKEGATKKIVDAVYDVAYTRIPNNERGGDGKPMSYDRKYNLGIAAERALYSLSGIKEHSPEMSFLRDAYFYPRLNVNPSGMAKDSYVLGAVKQDAELCAMKNKQMFVQGKVHR